MDICGDRCSDLTVVLAGLCRVHRVVVTVLHVVTIVVCAGEGWGWGLGNTCVLGMLLNWGERKSGIHSHSFLLLDFNRGLAVISRMWSTEARVLVFKII